MTPELDRWLWAKRWQPPAASRGLWTRFERKADVMYKPAYRVFSKSEMWIGNVEFRNQWQTFAFYPDHGVMFNKEILAEIYAMLRDLGRGMRLE